MAYHVKEVWSNDTGMVIGIFPYMYDALQFVVGQRKRWTNGPKFIVIKSDALITDFPVSADAKTMTEQELLDEVNQLLKQEGLPPFNDLRDSRTWG